jgi:hypothetical protein
MHIKTIASAAALSVALGLSGFAYAQDAAATTTLPTMIGNQTLTPEDAQRVKVRCDDLQNEANQAAGATDAESDTGTEDAASSSEESSGSEGDEAAVGAVDMDLITVEACLEAGFITAP